MKRRARLNEGHPAIFRGKDRTKPLRAFLTEIGKAKIEEARKRLAKLAKWKVSDVSNGDVVEYLARGEQETIAYLRDVGQIKS